MTMTMSVVLAYAAIYLIWGSTYLAIRVAVGAGVAFLVLRGPAGQVNLTAAFVLIAGTLTWAAGSLYSRPPRLPASVALGAGMPLLLGGLMLLMASMAVGEPARYVARDVSRASLWALAYLIVFGSLVGFTAYSWLLRVAPASRVGTHAYVNPLVAVALGWGMAGEPVTATTGMAAAAIAASVAMVLKGAH